LTVRAQRLAASKVLSHRQRLVFLGDQVRVLNALRHQRYFHTSASSETPNSRRCAQRLAASKVLSPARRWRFTKVAQVLNALRHQRYFHRRRAASRTTRSSAQRLAASKVLSHGALRNLSHGRQGCSTPCGIKGTFTFSPAIGPAR